jgi:hypothetical protein
MRSLLIQFGSFTLGLLYAGNMPLGQVKSRTIPIEDLVIVNETGVVLGSKVSGFHDGHHNDRNHDLQHAHDMARHHHHWHGASGLYGKLPKPLVEVKVDR